MMETVVFFPSSPVIMGTSKKSLVIQLSSVETMSSVDVNRSLSLEGRGGDETKGEDEREEEWLTPIMSEHITVNSKYAHNYTVIT